MTRLIGAALVAAVLVTSGCVAAIGNRAAAVPKVVELEGRYRIETIRLDNGSWALLKYRPDTGEAWYTRAADNDVWIPIVDEDWVEDSHYVFEPRTTGGSGWSVIRLDTHTGRTWITRNSVWVEVGEPEEIGS